MINDPGKHTVKTAALGVRNCTPNQCAGGFVMKVLP